MCAADEGAIARGHSVNWVHEKELCVSSVLGWMCAADEGTFARGHSVNWVHEKVWVGR
jgi:hypothetical protein